MGLMLARTAAMMRTPVGAAIAAAGMGTVG